MPSSRESSCRFFASCSAYGTPGDVRTIVVPNLLLVRNDFPANNACAITKLLFDRKADLETVHPAAKELDPKTAVDPEKHDLLMAALSHLPHLMAAALLKVASDISPEALSFAGPSFRDLTRVGASNPELWSDILAENAPALGEALGAFAGAMAQLGSEIKDRESMEGRFRQAREAYDALGGILVEKGGANVEVAIPVENRPGVFAEVTTLMGSNNINILDLYVRHSNTERAALVLTLDAEAAQQARELLRTAGFTAEFQG